MPEVTLSIDAHLVGGPVVEVCSGNELWNASLPALRMHVYLTGFLITELCTCRKLHLVLEFTVLGLTLAR